MTLDFIFWDEWRGSLDGRPTMWISRLFKLPFWRRAGKWLSLRVDLHKFTGTDDAYCYHTHPAYAVRIVLWGGYIEEMPREEGASIPRYAVLEPGSIGLVRPEFAHRVCGLLNGKASYSLWLRGPICADVKLIGEGWAKQRTAPTTAFARKEKP